MDLKIKKTICLMVGIMSILTIVGTISYAYFTATANMIPVEATLTTGIARVRFADNDNGVVTQLNFGESITKKFTIENTGTVDAYVKMYWVDIINTYLEGSLTYTLSYAETEDDPYQEIIIDKNVPRFEYPSKEILAEAIMVPTTKTYYYNLTITLNNLSDINQEADLSAVFNSKFAIEDINYDERYIYLPYNLKANKEEITKYEDGDKKEMFVFDHPSSTQTTNWTKEERRDYRYIGDDPNNYIEFNDEPWRIIGLFTVENANGEKEQLLKIIKDSSIGTMAANTVSKNDWSTMSLYSELNNYYNQTGNYTASSSVKGLNAIARSQVAKVKWYLGSSVTSQNLQASDYYSLERGTVVYGSNSISIIQNIGLMYPSDYAYTYANGVDDVCYTNCYYCSKGTPATGWLFNGQFQWTQIPDVGRADSLFRIYNTGTVHNLSNVVTNKFTVRPVVFLSSKVKIASGDGSQSNPYIIETH